MTWFNAYLSHISNYILLGILYAIFTLGKSTNPRVETATKLFVYKITRTIDYVLIEQNDKKVPLNIKTDPEVTFTIDILADSLRFVSMQSKDGGRNAMRKVSDNLKSDQSFYYAFLRTDLTPLRDITKSRKQEFLNEVNQLVERYAKEEDSGIELYD